MFRSRDLALILLVALIVVVAMICATVLAIRLDTEATITAAFGVVTAGVGIAGVALGRLSGASAPEREERA